MAEYTRYTKVSGMQGLGVGSEGSEVLVADSAGKLYHQGVPLVPVRVLSQAITVSAFTDDEATTGYLDLSVQLPVGAIPLGWKFVCTGPFDGDTSATIQVGTAADPDRFSADISQSVFTPGTVGSLVVAADALKGISAAVTPRVTVTTATDFTLCKAAGHGAGTLYLYYLAT